MVAPPYHVQRLVDDPNSFPHHTSVSALWNLKWKKPASLGIYPFADGNLKDFEPIFSSLIQSSGDNVDVFFNGDDYAKPFIPVGESLIAQAKEAEQAGKPEDARELFLRAATVYRIARFPINGRSLLSTKAWEAGKAAYLDAAPYLSPLHREVEIPYRHAKSAAGESAEDVIPVILTYPLAGNLAGCKYPVILLIVGLDGYRTDQRQFSSEHARRGFACLTVDIPGTGDCPAARNDPTSPERLWSSVLDWIDENGFDSLRVVVPGLSTGGYYALRIAHTHANRLLGVVSQGGGGDHMFDPEWIRAQNHSEYPLALADALALKFSYGSVEEYIADEPRKKFGLHENGILDMKCTRLLLINRMEDNIFPIDDYILALTRDNIKEAMFIDGAEHTAEPEAGPIIYEWVDKLPR